MFKRESGFSSQFTRMDAIGYADAAITIAGQRKAGMAFQGRSIRLSDFGWPRLYCGMAFSHMKTRERSGSAVMPSVRSEFFLCQHEQIILIPGNVLPGAANENADQGISVRSAVRELGRSPGAGQSAASFARGMT